MIAGIDAGPALGEYVAVVGGGAVMAGMLAGASWGYRGGRKEDRRVKPIGIRCGGSLMRSCGGGYSVVYPDGKEGL